MRIESVMLKNYRQFKDMEISFKKTSSQDLHVLIGVMGTGKTNLLNAINWCLYGDEPYLSKQSQQLPILNLKTIEEAEEGEDNDVIVEVSVQTEDNRRIIFTRKMIFRVYGVGMNPQKQDTIFEVKVSDAKGNMKILKDEDAQEWVERFVPQEIREFFFFDGERLDRYFREATAQNVRHAISVISQIVLIERVHKKIEAIRKEWEKEAGRANPQIEEIRRQLEQKENEHEDIRKQIEECNRQIKTAKEKIRECEEKLRGLPDTEKLEEERKRLLSEKENKEKRREDKIKEKQDFLYEYGKVIMLWPIIKNAIQVVKDKKEKREIPPTIDKGLLEDIIKHGFCNVCGRKLDSEAKKRVEELLKEIKISSDIAQQLLYMEYPLIQLADKIKSFKKDIERITKEIQEYDEELTDIEKKIAKIDKDLSGYDKIIDKIRKWHQERIKYEKIHDDNQQKLGILQKQKQEIEGEIKSLRERLNDELKKEKKVKKLKKQIDFCTQALNVLERTKEKIMDDVRREIENTTKKLFFEIIWKRDSFANVTIDENYNINLIHKMGYECLGTVSGGEREVLTLAFTMALHNISGFDSPLVIDRPLAMVSGSPREKIVGVLSQISEYKQAILFFTPDDYSPDISSTLDTHSSNRYKLTMSSDEKETIMEVL